MSDFGRAYHLAATGTIGPIGATGGGGGFLKSVHINKVIAAAVVTVYDGQDTTGRVVAVLDASASPRYHDFECWLQNGVTVVLSGGNADITVVVT